MATIGKLAVVVSASTGAFTTNLKRAVAPLREFGSQVTSVGSKVVSLTGAITALAAGASLVALTKSAFDSAGALARTADKLGVATESLARLRYAASLSGIETEALDKSLSKMSLSISKAALGTGEAVGAIAELGLNAKDLANLPADQQLLSIADAMANVQNAGDRARICVALFGEEGAGMAGMLAKGREGLAAAGAEADKFGLAISRVDAAKVQAANQSFTRLKSMLEGAAMTLAVQLSPFIEAAISKLVSMGAAGEGMSKAIITGFEWVLKAVAYGANVFDGFKIVIKSLQIAFAWLFQKAMEGARGLAKGLAWVVNTAIDAINWLIQKANKLPGVNIPLISTKMSTDFETLDAMIEGEKDLINELKGDISELAKFDHAQKVTQFFADLRAKADANAQAVAKNAEAMRGAAANTEDYAKKLQEAAAKAQKVTDTIEELQKQIATFGMSEGQKKLHDLAALGVATPEQMAQAEKLVGQLDALEKAKKVADALVEMQKELATAGAATEGQRKLIDLQAMGASPEQLAEAQKLVAQLDALDKLKKRQDDLAQKAKSLADTLATPMQKYEQTIQDLNDMLASGLISFDLYAKGVQKARQELEGMGETDIKGPEAMQAGTAVAQRYVWDMTTGQQRMTKDELQKKALAEAQQSSRLLERIEKNTAKNKDAVTVMDM